MRNAFAPIALVATLMLSTAAFADPMAASGSSATTTAAPTAKPPHSGKHAACKSAWLAQTAHTEAKKDFMRACLGKA
jgi:hypothetical protein